MSVHELFAYLRVRNAAKAIAFYEAAFGGKELFRLTEPSGRVGHAEIDFNGHVLMVSDEFPEFACMGPETIGATTVTLHLHVDNADQVIERAISAGATLVRPPTDAFYGERSGVVRDPFGHEWNIGHSIEKVTPDEMQRRYTAMLTKS
ncbi:VOC family protein [Pendulispora albinea]|uniref:VOC family protein n=1 Tax=Pendulispora albinea TaxID=2741071 RepID=A0ABZ2M4A9_9BACT